MIEARKNFCLILIHFKGSAKVSVSVSVERSLM